MKKNTLLAATVLASLVVSTQAMAGASGNIGVTNNYIWRGVTQTDNSAAVSGGLDYESPNGLYVGTWASNVDFGKKGTEVDLYGGYKKELASGLSYDVGAIRYAYPGDAVSGDFTEIYGKLGYKGVSGEVGYTVDKEGDPDKKNDVYYGLGYDGELKNGVGYGVKAGHYNYDDPTVDDYSHYQVSLSKDDFTFAVDDNDLPDTDPMVSVSWSKSFDF
ncbi:TorF family putative porin [Candidatus Thiothrix sp. Deng01]|uniref:TorF family putative porin n=1 Tax=Candidatus Thiothrix phosphatis TaxID=3112415 RepID=A0ABU6CVA5_9GAMM|nr:TorF family putative porin [Candidatus Thiothrix sp. Deng01]MEB4590462.1 TorF family putative porin [Candidatus Thiothrix sp. Deng01]